jgi:bifunctional ADP-heptose synthase (sugar kinase/adenylyltransferase)
VSFGIEDRLAIHELLALHGHLVDEGRLADEDLSLLFDAEVRYDVTEMGGQVLEGLAAIRAAGLALGEGNPVAHLVTNIVVSARR